MAESTMIERATVPTDGMLITQSLCLEPGLYFLPQGLTIAADGVTLDGNGAILVGDRRAGCGIRVDGRRDVSIKNFGLREYRHGIHASDCEKLRVERNHISGTAEIDANTIFLNIWLAAAESYGGAILLERTRDSAIVGNDIQHQMNGLLTYDCSRLSVRENNASYNSGYGIHLFGTSDSLFECNWADYCCRYEPRGEGVGHMGADATGFLIVHSSCRNTFRDNFARLGGDGFFLAGLHPDGTPVPCNENLFEGNDGSLSPNIAFEATFSSANVFRNNRADRCNYGFWLGFSAENVLENNRMVMNRQAGIAVENGQGFTVRGNSFQRNGCGVMVWSRREPRWHDQFPDRRTAHHWTIEGNKFTRNDKGIYIAADRDHGIRPLPPEQCGLPELRPHDFTICGNDLQDNRVGVELHATDRVVVEGNTINHNVECNVRREDDNETTLRNNLGCAGGYL
jgi:parallel beta-helix repeat protein